MPEDNEDIDLEKLVNLVNDKIQNKKGRIENDAKNRAQLERELKESKDQAESRRQELDKKNTQIDSLTKEMKNLRLALEKAQKSEEELKTYKDLIKKAYRSLKKGDNMLDAF
ncbi:hypothetical protein EG329_006078 [Mollisiaceae sp. DMI_Dod_QoI]|nr:hypothetical protein EG329_006078 [Helotiales sp. DMI_Dod_QoI]